MTKPKILVALLGEPIAVERIIVRKHIDELMLIFTDDEYELAESLTEKYSILGLQVIPIHIRSLRFSNILSSILKVLNKQKADDSSIEFSISSGNPIIILATCIVSAIVDTSISYTGDNGFFEISEIWPGMMINISHKKRLILSFLENYGSPINQKNIAKEMGINQSGISRHIHDLELAGYVKRTRVNKSKIVKISDLGSVILHQKEIRKRRIWAPHSVGTSESFQTVS